MGRATVTLRCAAVSDADALRELWADVLRTATAADQVADVVSIIEAAMAPDAVDQRVVVAELDGRVVGGVLLRAAPISPVNLDLMVQAVAPHVLPEAQRRGVGSALMEAAVAFAEERGIAYVGAAAVPGSRDSNRFFARLAMGPLSVLRIASTQGMRQRLSSSRTVMGASSPQRGTRHIDRVLAARRSRRSARVG